jgi:hypothetical protein
MAAAVDPLSFGIAGWVGLLLINLEQRKTRVMDQSMEQRIGGGSPVKIWSRRPARTDRRPPSREHQHEKRRWRHVLGTKSVRGGPIKSCCRLELSLSHSLMSFLGAPNRLDSDLIGLSSVALALLDLFLFFSHHHLLVSLAFLGRCKTIPLWVWSLSLVS